MRWTGIVGCVVVAVGAACKDEPRPAAPAPPDAAGAPGDAAPLPEPPTAATIWTTSVSGIEPSELIRLDDGRLVVAGEMVGPVTLAGKAYQNSTATEIMVVVASADGHAQAAFPIYLGLRGQVTGLTATADRIFVSVQSSGRVQADGVALPLAEGAGQDAIIEVDPVRGPRRAFRVVDGGHISERNLLALPDGDLVLLGMMGESAQRLSSLGKRRWRHPVKGTTLVSVVPPAPGKRAVPLFGAWARGMIGVAAMGADGTLEYTCSISHDQSGAIEEVVHVGDGMVAFGQGDQHSGYDAWESAFALVCGAGDHRLVELRPGAKVGRVKGAGLANGVPVAVFTSTGRALGDAHLYAVRDPASAAPALARLDGPSDGAVVLDDGGIILAGTCGAGGCLRRVDPAWSKPPR